MRLAILHPYQLRMARGTERFLWSLSGALCAGGVQVDLLTWAAANPVVWGPTPDGLRVFAMPNMRYYRARMAVAFYAYHLARTRYDWVLHTSPDTGEAAAIALTRWRGQRHAISIRFPQEASPRRFAAFGRRGQLASADLATTVSDYVAAQVLQQHGVRPHVIPNGVDAGRFAPSAAARAAVRSSLGVADNAPVLITVAALEVRKGVQRVLAALPGLVKVFPRLDYWVVGEGPQHAALEAQAQQLSVARHVQFLGRQSQPERFLAAADVFALPATGEAFANAMLEAMACGLPLMLSDDPSFDATAQPAYSVRAALGAANGVQDALAWLLSDLPRARVMGQAGRSEVLARYTWGQVAERYLVLMDVPPRPA